MSAVGAAAESMLVLFGFGGLMVVALIASFIVGRRFRPAGRKRVIDDPETLALLARDADRFVDVVLTRLLARRAITTTPFGKLEIAPGSNGETAVERSLLALPSPFKWEAARQAVKGEIQAMLRPLVDQGLIADAQQLRRRQKAQVAPLLAIFLPAAMLWLVSWSGGHGAFALGFLIMLTGLLIFIRWTGVDRRTTGGIDTLDAAAVRHDRLQRGTPRDELAMGVALFGTAILAGSQLHAYHKMRQASDSSSGDAGAGAGGGGGGCGGGCGGD